MATLIQLRRDTAANWSSNNPILSSGEVGIATDLQQFKIGDGVSTWNVLEYVNAIPSQYLSLSNASATYLTISDASSTYIPLTASTNFDLFGSASAAEINAKNYTDSQITSIIDSAPGTLDTLNELAAALGDDANFAASTASAIGERLTIANASAIYLSISNAADTYIPLTSSVNFDLAGSASAAEFNAKAYADSLAPNYDSAGSASAAQTAAQSYADSLASNYDSVGSASAAEFNAKAYADSLSTNYDAAGSASAAQSAAQSYADTQISNLVDSAPETLNTLNELAAALGDDPNFATSTASAIGQRLTIANASATYLSITDASTIYAPLISPALTGIPTAPTASVGTNSTQIATTAFVENAIAILDGGGP